MFDSLINWLVDPIQSVCSTVTAWFLQVMTMTVSEFMEQFPSVSVLYAVLQAASIGMIVVIAGWSFMKVILGSQYATESPLKTAGFAALAVAMVYFGNHLLELTINLFSYPYSAIFAADTTTVDVDAAFSTMVGIIWDSVSGIGFLLGKSIIFIVIMFVFVWKLFKLIGEMLQRWMMLSIMVYTSPLAWTLLAGSGTRQMFTRWVNMFVSQCVVLLLNAWCVKLILSTMGDGLSTIAGLGGTFGFIRYFLLISCFIKIATSMDSYVAQIGLNPVQVGRSFLDDMAQTASHMGRTLIGGSLMRGFGSAAGGAATLGSSAQRSAASAATQNINSRTNMTAGQRIGNAITHPIRTAQAMAMENREAVAGNMYRDKATGKAYTGNEAKNILAQHRRTGKLPDGVEAIYGNSAAVETGTAVAGNIMAANHVHTEKHGNTTTLQGTKTDIGNTIAHAGGVVDGTPYQTAFNNAAAALDTAVLNDTINESVHNNGTVADHMLENLAQKSGIGTDVAAANLEQVNERANALGVDGQEFLMNSTGSATALTAAQAQELHQSLNTKFGDTSNGQNFKNMFDYAPANSASGAQYNIGDMTDSGAAAALTHLQETSGTAIQSASANFEHAQKLYEQAADAELRHNRSQANYLTNQANQYQTKAIEGISTAYDTLNTYSAHDIPEITLSQVSSEDSMTETAEALQTVTHAQEQFDFLNTGAAVPESATWTDMNSEAQQTEVKQYASNFQARVASGKSQEAVESCIATIGYATPTGHSVENIKTSTAETANDTVNDMVYGQNHANVHFTGSSVHQGEGHGTMRYQAFDPATGKYNTVYDDMHIATDKVDSQKRQGFVQHRVGEAVFYTRRKPRTTSA